MIRRYTDHLLIEEVKENLQLPAIRTDKPGAKAEPGRKNVSDHVVWLDETVIPGSHLYTEALWYWPNPEAALVKGGEVGMVEHSHAFEEVLAFFGGDFMHPRDLGAELEVTLAGEKHIVNKTSLIFVPAGMPHSFKFKKITGQVFHFSAGASSVFSAEEVKKVRAAKNTAQYIVSKLIPPQNEAPWSPPPPPEATGGKSGRILFLDKDIVAGGFYTECVWIAPRQQSNYLTAADQPARTAPSVKPHKHNFAEILCFFGTDPNDITRLDSQIELWVNDELHIFNKSVMVYLPAGTWHCPLTFKRVGMPLIHFTCFPEGKLYYDEIAKATMKK
jgi:hypothetical protein